MRTTHSERTLETLNQMGVTTKGWRYPDIEWKEVEMEVETIVMCPTCHGRGVLYDDKSHDLKQSQCPKCPPRRNIRGYGTGLIRVMKLRKVQIGVIKWPEGTIFGSRFHKWGDTCQLCGKSRIKRWVPVLNDQVTPPRALYVGEDCGRTILGVASMSDTTFEIDAKNATKHSAAMKAWREIPKPPKVKKPETPKLPDDMPKKETIDIILRHYFVDVYNGGRLNTSRAEWEFWFILDDTTRDSPESRQGFTIKYSARHGITISADMLDKPFVKKKGIVLPVDDLNTAIATAIPMMQKHMALPVPEV